MKTHRTTPHTKTRSSLLALAIGLMLLGPAGTARADDLVVNTFDFDISGIAWQNWRSYVLSHELTWDASQDADENPNSGSMYITVDWPTSDSVPPYNTGWNDVQVAFAAGSFDPADYLELEAYIKIDVTNSSPAMNGNSYGVSGLYLSGGNGGWRQIQGFRVLNLTNGWQRVSGSLAAIAPGTTSSQVVVGFISQSGNTLTNTVRYWLDNVRLIGPPSVYTNRPLLNIAKAPPAGLTCVASQPGDAWQRATARPLGDNFSWHTSVAASNTTTYAITVADIAGGVHSGFEAILYLISANGINNPDTCSDWPSANVVYFTVTANANGTGTGNFRYKINSPGTEPNPWPAYASHICAAGPLGTWKLSFADNVNVTITAPDGTSTQLTIPAQDADNFAGGLYAYLGVRPASTTRIGQSATFSRITITGTAIPLDDTFISSGPPYTLELNAWMRTAPHSAGIFVTAPDAKYWVSWPLPDGGYTNLFATDNLSKRLANNEWVALPVDATGWLNVAGASRLTVINQSALNGAFSYTPTNCFFGLFHP